MPTMQTWAGKQYENMVAMCSAWFAANVVRAVEMIGIAAYLQFTECCC